MAETLKYQDGKNKWKPKALHTNLHCSAVMGVAGMQQKQIVLSAGADRRIFGYEVHVGRADFKHQIGGKCMSVLPNPCDFSLFMVQTGSITADLDSTLFNCFSLVFTSFVVVHRNFNMLQIYSFICREFLVLGKIKYVHLKTVIYDLVQKFEPR